MRLAVLLALATTPAFAQTAAHRTAVHHTAARPTSAAAAIAQANAPGIPKVTAPPNTLYTLRYIDLVVGTGPLAEPRKWYSVNYTGWLTDGTKFDSSFDHTPAGPISFPYGAQQVIAGWDTGFGGMHVGGKRRLLIPYQLAYGEAGNPKIPGKAALIFDVELVSMSDTRPAPPAAPAAKPTVPTTPTTPTTPDKPSGK